MRSSTWESLREMNLRNASLLAFLHLAMRKDTVDLVKSSQQSKAQSMNIFTEEESVDLRLLSQEDLQLFVDDAIGNSEFGEVGELIDEQDDSFTLR